MPKPPSTLSNCYVPLPLLPEENEAKVAASTTKRRTRDAGDGKSRSTHGLRRLVLQSSSMNGTGAAAASSNTNDGIPSSSSSELCSTFHNTGSTLVELGHTKVLCQVLAPLSSSSSELPSNTQQQLGMDQGTLLVQVKYVPQIAYPTSTLLASSVSTVENTSNNSQQQQSSIMSAGKLNSWIVMRETDLSARLYAALAAAVPLQQYPKCAILVNVTVLQDDGSILPACITAASLALTDAAVEVYDLVTSCSVAVVKVPKNRNDKDDAEDEDDSIELWADPTLEEELDTSTISCMTLAVLPNCREVTIWEQSGRLPLSPDQANQIMEMCRDGCRTMHRFMREHLIQQQQEYGNVEEQE